MKTPNVPRGAAMHDLDTIDLASFTEAGEALALIPYLGGIAGALELLAESGELSSPVKARTAGAAALLRIAVEHLRYETGRRERRP